MMYYNLDWSNNFNSVYNLIIGDAGIGKTYAVFNKFIEDYLSYNKKFIIIVKSKCDVKPIRQNKILESLKCNEDVKYKDRNFYIKINGNYVQCGKAFCFKEKIKEDLTDYKNVLFDEFTRHETDGEFVDFMNLISQIARKRTDIKVFLIGNRLTEKSEYYKGFDIGKQRVAVQYISMDTRGYKNEILLSK